MALEVIIQIVSGLLSRQRHLPLCRKDNTGIQRPFYIEVTKKSPLSKDTCASCILLKNDRQSLNLIRKKGASFRITPETIDSSAFQLPLLVHFSYCPPSPPPT